LDLRSCSASAGTTFLLPTHAHAARAGIALKMHGWCDPAADGGLRRELLQPSWVIEDADLAPTGWRQHSRPHPDGRIHSGYLGTLQLGEVSDVGRLLLQSAEIFHAGGGASSRYGQILAAR
jgi:hypothetical protein